MLVWVVTLALRVAVVWWAWATLAPTFNAPPLGYWQCWCLVLLLQSALPSVTTNTNTNV